MLLRVINLCPVSYERNRGIESFKEKKKNCPLECTIDPWGWLGKRTWSAEFQRHRPILQFQYNRLQHFPVKFSVHFSTITGQNALNDAGLYLTDNADRTANCTRLRHASRANGINLYWSPVTRHAVCPEISNANRNIKLNSNTGFRTKTRWKQPHTVIKPNTLPDSLRIFRWIPVRFSDNRKTWPESKWPE